MSEISNAIQDKCLAFSDRIIKLNDYLLEKASKKYDVRSKKSKSYIALKEARESLYWLELLHRNNYIDDKQYNSIYADCEELVKILVTRCKRINEEIEKK